MTRQTQPWIHSARLDSAFILAPAFLSTFFVLLAQARALPLDSVSPLTWLLLIVGVDVAHVYSTLYRTYLDPRELARRRNLYLLAPVLAWVAGTLLYTAGALTFWRALAYLAVFHFVRQQYGFAMIYSRQDAPRTRWSSFLDRAVIYLATLYPLAYWHTHLPRDFHWFVAGDFVALPGWVERVALWAYVAVLAAYAWKEITLFARSGRFNVPRNLIVSGTALSWYVGIVHLDGDLAFTATNVVTHGIPYLALVWSHGRRGALREPSRGLFAGLKARLLFSRGAVPLFVGFLFTLAFLEEALWDSFVWRDHPGIFAAFTALPRVTDREMLAWLVPLLALPQITHYVLDGFLWKRKDDEATGGGGACLKPLGKHLLVEFFGCDVSLLSDRARLRELMLEATRASGATIVTDVFHEFNPYGLSGVVVIAESHVAIHTWPEHSCASLDVFTCGESMNPYVIRDLLKTALRARDCYSSEVERGVPRESGRQPAGRPHGKDPDLHSPSS